MTDLEKARLLIDETDRSMAELFSKRMDAARQVALFKAEHGLQVEDKAREEQIISRNSQWIENDEYRSYYIKFLQQTMAISREFQQKILDGKNR